MSRTLSRLKGNEETRPRKLCTRIAVSSYLLHFLPPSTQVQPFGGSGTAPSAISRVLARRNAGVVISHFKLTADCNWFKMHLDVGRSGREAAGSTGLQIVVLYITHTKAHYEWGSYLSRPRWRTTSEKNWEGIVRLSQMAKFKERYHNRWPFMVLESCKYTAQTVEIWNPEDAFSCCTLRDLLIATNQSMTCT